MPPSITLMLYHYSVARAASQGTGPLSGTFAACWARGGSSTGGKKRGLNRCSAGLMLKTGGLDTDDAPAFRFLGQDNGHAHAAGIRFFELSGGFPHQGGHGGFTADELNIFDFADRLGPASSGEDKSCCFVDALRTNPQIALRVHKLAIRGKHRGKLCRLTIAPCLCNLHHGNKFRRGLLEFPLLIVQRTNQFFADLIERQAALLQKTGSQTILFVKNSEKYMFRSDVLGSEPLRLFGSFIQDALALRTDRNFDGSR